MTTNQASKSPSCPSCPSCNLQHATRNPQDASCPLEPASGKGRNQQTKRPQPPTTTSQPINQPASDPPQWHCRKRQRIPWSCGRAGLIPGAAYGHALRRCLSEKGSSLCLNPTTRSHVCSHLQSAQPHATLVHATHTGTAHPVHCGLA